MQASRNGIRICDLIGSPALLREKLEALILAHKSQFPSLVSEVDAEFEKYKAFGMIFPSRHSISLMQDPDLHR